MALTYTEVSRQTIGNKVLTCYAITGDGSVTTITALAMKLSRIECAWLSDINDAQELYLSTYSGSTVEVDTAIQSGQIQLLFCIGS